MVHSLHRGLFDNMLITKFRFDIAYSPLYTSKFVLDFFNSPIVRSTLSTILTALPTKANKIDYNTLSTKVISMDFFDCLQKNEIVKAGYIRKDFEDVIEGISICDKLRQSFLVEESDAYLAFTTSDRCEFIFHILKRLSLGGGMCQYEDMIEPYLDATKQFYKDLISVAKDSESGQLVIQSNVLEVTNVEGVNMYKCKDHPQNFFYLIINSSERTALVFYHKWVGYWG